MNSEPKKAWQYVQAAQANLLDAWRALDELRLKDPEAARRCEEAMNAAYRTASQAQAVLYRTEKDT